MTRTPRKCQLVFGDEPGRIVNPFGQRRRCESARNRVNTDSCRQSSYAHALCPDALWHGKPTDNYHEKHAENRHARVKTVSRFPPCGNRRLPLTTPPLTTPPVSRMMFDGLTSR